MTGKPIIHMQLETEERPFDVVVYRAIPFALARHADHEKAKVDLKNFLNEALADNYQQDNPVTNALGRLRLEQNATPEMRVMMEEMDQLKSGMNDIQRTIGLLTTQLWVRPNQPPTASNALGAIPPGPVFRHLNWYGNPCCINGGFGGNALTGFRPLRGT